MLRNQNRLTFPGTSRPRHAAPGRGRAFRHRPSVERLEDRVVLSGFETWYPSSNPTQPVSFGAGDWVPVGLSNGDYAAVDTSGQNPFAPTWDVWFLHSNAQPFRFGAAGWVPVGLSNGDFAAVDTSGDNSTYPHSDVWYLHSNPTPTDLLRGCRLGARRPRQRRLRRGRYVGHQFGVLWQ